MLRGSISRKLVIMFGLTTLSIALTYAVCLRESLRESLNKQMHNELQFRFTLMEPLITSRTAPTEWSQLGTRMASLSTTEGGRVQYWITSSDPAYHIGGPPPQGITLSQLKDGFSKIAKDNPAECPLYLLTKTIPAHGIIPSLHFIVAIDSTPYINTLNEFTRVLIFITTSGVLLVTVSGYIISRRGLRPVELLSKQANQLVPGVDGQRLNTQTLPCELRPLAVAFNGLLARQDKAWSQLECFNANVAHELKTPLTNLIGQTQFSLSRRRTIEQLEDALESNLEEMSRMASIVNDMLFLSHAQTGKFTTQCEKISLKTEAVKTVEYIEPIFSDKNLHLSIEGEATVFADRRLFNRALANLLENSARHAFVDSMITIRLSEKKDTVYISVENAGEQIESHHLERLFERFYRVDSSRTQSDTNHGLGLSIIKAIAYIHGGDVFATSSHGINTFGFTISKNS